MMNILDFGTQGQIELGLTNYDGDGGGSESSLTNQSSQKSGARSSQVATGGGGGCQKVVQEKSYRRIDKFSGNETDWKGWEFDFMMAKGATSPRVAEALELIEHAPGIVTGETLELLMAILNRTLI